MVKEPSTCKAIWVPAHAYCPLVSKVMASPEKLEKVVKPPNKPVIRKRRVSALMDGLKLNNAMSKPMK